MRWLTEHWLVLTLFLIYSLILFYNGVIGRRRAGSLRDYYVGGRKMGGMAIGISFYATYASTNSYIGNAGQGYTFGLPWLLLTGFMVVFAVISWTLVAPRLRQFTQDWDSVTLPDFFAARFDSNAARVISAVVIVFASTLYMTAVFKGIGNLFEVFFDIPYELAIFIVLSIVMFYTASGGFISVVRTDIVQGVLMVIGAVTLVSVVAYNAGGIGAILDVRDVSAAGARMFTWDAAMPFPVLLGVLLAASMKLVVEPRQLSRFFALKDKRSVRQGIWVAVVGIAVIQFCILPIGIYAHLFLTNVADTDLIVPTLVASEMFPDVLAAFLVLAMVAAAMSSLDSVLLVTASTLERDVVSLAFPNLSDNKNLNLTRIFVVVISLVTALIALRPPGGVVKMTIFSGSMYAACFFPALVVGLHWRRGSAAAAVTSMLTGLVVLAIWTASDLNTDIHEIFPALVASLIAYVTVSYLSAPTDTDQVRRSFA